MTIEEIPNTEFKYKISFANPDLVFKDWEEMYDWCAITFGKGFDNSVHQSVYNPAKWTKQWFGVRFRNLEHAQWFVLRFSGTY